MRPDTPPVMRVSRAFGMTYKGLVVAFLALCLLSALLWSGILKTGLVIDTDLRALLPEGDHSTLSHHAETQLLSRLGNTIVLLVGASNAETATQAADFARRWLLDHTSLSVKPGSPLDQDPDVLLQTLKDHRFHLLTPEQRQRLRDDNAKTLIDRAWASLLGPQSWARVTSTQEDPLALFDGFVEWLGQSSGTANLRRQGEYPLFSTAQRPGWFFAPLYIDSGAQTFQLETQARTVATLEQLQAVLKQRFPGIQTLKSGVIFHAAEAAQRARSEVTLIGLGSLLGIVALFIAAFRSPRPLLMSLASVVFGCVIAFSVVHYLYAGLHIITLVFGAALIGVSVDYSLHYFSRLFATGGSTYRFACLRAIFPAISLGLITSVIGYGSLSQAPLPGLQQVALFSVTGLIAAWLFVVVTYPWLGIRTRRPLPTYLIRWALLPQRLWQNLGQWHLNPAALLTGLGVLGALGTALTVTTNDDIRVLHAPSAALMAQERAVKTIIDNYAGNQFFIVSGASRQAVLENEEAFRPRLDELVASGAIAGYLAMSRLLPSLARQQEDYRLQHLKLYGDPQAPGPVPRFMEQLGFEPAASERLQHHFIASKQDYLTAENMPDLQASGIALLQLGRIDGQFANLILLRGITDTATLAALAGNVDEVVFVDRVHELGQVLKQQRHAATEMLALAYGVVLILLILRYRRVDALLLALVPLTATLLTLTLLSLAGMPIGLFHLFALFLILGLGMDYSIFIYESPATETASHTAVLFSAVTSCLSFGLLALSSTPMVQFFGATVLLGSILNLLLAPAVARLPVEPRLNKPTPEVP